MPQVEVSIVSIPEVLQLHVGQGALGVAATLRGTAESAEATEAAADKSAEPEEMPDAPETSGANGEKAEDNGAESSDIE